MLPDQAQLNLPIGLCWFPIVKRRHPELPDRYEAFLQEPWGRNVRILEMVKVPTEAQAFKRACSCFGLGRYLYHFTGAWVDLDDRKRPKNIPRLFGWATPQGWRGD